LLLVYVQSILFKAELTCCCCSSRYCRENSLRTRLSLPCTHIGASPPTFVPDLDVPFDLEFRRTLSIDDFEADLAEHLGKTQKEKEIGEKVETYFVSTSPILEWAIHTAGQMSKDTGWNEVVGLAIFDVKKLRQNFGTTIFRVSDVLSFLASEGKDTLIEQNLQKWARNCDEYVSVGQIPDDGFVRWVVWEELYALPASIISDRFVRAYTLGIYRQWIQVQHVELESICQKIFEFGKVLVGPRDDLLFPLVELILRPGILFWGFETESSEDIIKAKIRALF